MLRATSPSSAAVVVPILAELVRPTSVLDVGCGTNDWLRAFGPEIRTLGIDELPVDQVGSPGYERRNLDEPFDVGRWDLALCLEVGEHLRAELAPQLVAALVQAAPVVAFSAAIPEQHGYGHVNMQWPDWWASLFAAHGYRQYD